VVRVGCVRVEGGGDDLLVGWPEKEPLWARMMRQQARTRERGRATTRLPALGPGLAGWGVYVWRRGGGRGWGGGGNLLVG